MSTQLIRLTVSCVILGIGVAMLLIAALGSDGYSTMVNGLSIAFDVKFWVVNLVVGILLVLMAWVRGLKPGMGTIVQPLVVGFVVSGLLDAFDEPDSMWIRIALLVLSFPVVAVGVAGYLAVDAGAGPTEAAALAFDPPVPFKWSYSVVQGGGALLGWLCGAAIGPGTVMVIFLLGPMVDWLSARFAVLSIARVND
ncbi:YczE/YyaS/YitT family protein [Aeromicrobium sp.]|uniref:YczE/YyaS/YitT family protein n=1 Tax=Aeromicrobium sp. TaxID=1871063 RepID=UPI002FC93A72